MVLNLSLSLALIPITFSLGSPAILARLRSPRTNSVYVLPDRQVVLLYSFHPGCVRRQELKWGSLLDLCMACLCLRSRRHQRRGDFRCALPAGEGASKDETENST
jgi:hypothetical protein